MSRRRDPADRPADPAKAPAALPATSPVAPVVTPQAADAAKTTEPASLLAARPELFRPPRARRPGRPPRKGDDTGDSSREKLLDAAINLFADWGYEPVSTAAVARAAGLSQSMVHYHFGSKEQLWRAAIDRLMRRRGQYFPVTRLATHELNPVERLKLLIRRLVEANAAEPHYIRIVTHEAMGRTQRFDWLMEKFVQPGIFAFDEAIADAMAQGLIRPLPPHQTSSIITSAASMTFSIGAVTLAMHGRDPYAPDQIASYGDTIVSLLFDGLLTRPDDSAPPAAG
ncbi:TetR/AcrR family transcriptional regulator [Camelimonas sp. ID_303_24]